MKIVPFFSGRLGSHRLPRKLLLPLGKSNLWEIACMKYKEIGAYALCNEPELVEIAERVGCKVLLRDPQTSNVDGPLNFIYKDIDQLDATHYLWINPCLPFLKVSTIQKVMEVGEDYVESVRPFQNWLFKDENPVYPINMKTLSTKDIPKMTQGGHAFRLFKAKEFFTEGFMLREGFYQYELSKMEALDIDDLEDYEIAKKICN